MVLVLEGECPNCFGNLELIVETGTLKCEDCSYSDITHSKRNITLAKEKAAEWGPLEARKELSPMGSLLRESWKEGPMIKGLLEVLCETADEALRGLELDEEGISLLKNWGLVKDGTE